MLNIKSFTFMNTKLNLDIRLKKTLILVSLDSYWLCVVL
jgi:hypothetical protein